MSLLFCRYIFLFFSSSHHFSCFLVLSGPEWFGARDGPRCRCKALFKPCCTHVGEWVEWGRHCRGKQGVCQEHCAASTYTTRALYLRVSFHAGIGQNVCVRELECVRKGVSARVHPCVHISGLIWAPFCARDECACLTRTACV